MPDLKLIVIDPFARFGRLKDINNYTEVSAAMETLMTVSQGHEAHLLAVHHKNKRETDDPRDSTLDSSALNAGVDSVLTLEQGRDSGIISTAQRIGPLNGAHKAGVGC